MPLFAAACLLGAAGAPAFAADASPWEGDNHASVRLVAGRAQLLTGSRLLRAGVEFKLQSGWKTYWRYPGDSGVPPIFDFGDSENIKSVTVLWPAPERFTDGSGNSIGYKDNVILPLHVLPRDENRPVILRVKLDYAVCEQVCVPAKAALELQLARIEGVFDPAVLAAEARVPKQTSIGSGQSLVIRAVHRVLGALRGRVLVDVATPAPTMVDLFAEGPTPKWALPVPEPVPGTTSTLQSFRFDIDGMPPGAVVDGATLKLTAVSKKGQAIEVEYRLE